MAKVIRRRNEDGTWSESVDELIKRFTRKFVEEGTLKELRDREYFKSKGQKRREQKMQEARNAWIAKKKAERYSRGY